MVTAREWIHQDDNVKEFYQLFDSMGEAQRQYECFVSCVESGHIKPEEFESYGFPAFPPPLKTEGGEG